MDITIENDILKYKNHVEQNKVLLDIIIKQQEEINNLKIELENAEKKTKYKKVIHRINKDYWYY
jgi:hypothetical protein